MGGNNMSGNNTNAIASGGDQNSADTLCTEARSLMGFKPGKSSMRNLGRAFDLAVAALMENPNSKKAQELLEDIYTIWPALSDSKASKETVYKIVEARKSLNKGADVTARSIILGALRDSPNFAYVHLVLAEVYEFQKKFKAAKKEYTKARALDLPEGAKKNYAVMGIFPVMRKAEEGLRRIANKNGKSGENTPPMAVPVAVRARAQGEASRENSPADVNNRRAIRGLRAVGKKFGEFAGVICAGIALTGFVSGMFAIVARDEAVLEGDGLKAEIGRMQERLKREKEDTEARMAAQEKKEAEAKASVAHELILTIGHYVQKNLGKARSVDVDGSGKKKLFRITRINLVELPNPNAFEAKFDMNGSHCISGSGVAKFRVVLENWPVRREMPMELVIACSKYGVHIADEIISDAINTLDINQLYIHPNAGKNKVGNRNLPLDAKRGAGSAKSPVPVSDKGFPHRKQLPKPQNKHMHQKMARKCKA
jgi:hypothetical protein